MSTNHREIPWPDPNHLANRAKVPLQELASHAGKQVAWSWDGTRILASGEDLEAVWQALVQASIDPRQVVYGYVDPS